MSIDKKQRQQAFILSVSFVKSLWNRDNLAGTKKFWLSGGSVLNASCQQPSPPPPLIFCCGVKLLDKLSVWCIFTSATWHLVNALFDFVSTRWSRLTCLGEHKLLDTRRHIFCLFTYNNPHHLQLVFVFFLPLPLSISRFYQSWYLFIIWWITFLFEPLHLDASLCNQFPVACLPHFLVHHLHFSCLIILITLFP